MTQTNRLLNKKFKEYLLPTVLSSMSLMIGNIVDGILVGQILGSSFIGSVNLAATFTLLLQSLMLLFGLGGCALVSVLKAQQNGEKASRVFTLSTLAMLALSCLLAMLGLFFSPAATALLCNNQAIFEATRQYLQVLMLGSPALLLVPGMVYFMRADGFPGISGKVLLVANLVNLCMDVVFMKLLGFGIRGAALATVTGYVVGFFLVLRYLRKKQRSLRFTRLQKKDLPLLGEVVGSGVSGFVNTLLLTVKSLLLCRIVLAVGGTVGMEIFTVCNYLLCFVSMFNSGSAETMIPLLGMLYGERNWQGIRFILRQTLRIVLVAAGVCILLSLLFPQLILALFNVSGSQQVLLGVPALRLYALGLAIMGVSFLLMYYYQTIRHRNISLMISVLRGFALIVSFAFLFSLWFGLLGVFLAFVVAELSTLFICLMVCRVYAARSKGRYQGVLLQEQEPQLLGEYSEEILAKPEDIVAASERFIQYARKMGLQETQCIFLGLAVEEAGLYILSQNQEAGAGSLDMDFLLKIYEEHLLLRIKDNGTNLVPLPSEPPQQPAPYGSLYTLRKISEKVNHQQLMGLNQTVIELRRAQKPE